MSGTSGGGPIRLLYDQTQGKWTGSYRVQTSDPLGVWTLQVTALDPYGNSGQSSTSLFVIPPPAPAPQPPPPQNQFTSLWIIAVITAIAASALIGFVYLRRKRMLPPDLQVDMKAVEVEASRFMGQNFFKSIQEQLVKNQDQSEGEKDG
jgi:hypothetical protein